MICNCINITEKELVRLCFGYFRENLIAQLKYMHLDVADAKDAEDTLRDFKVKVIFHALNDYIDAFIYRGVVGFFIIISLYPLCMKLNHENLRKDHHSKHRERVYNIFYFYKLLGFLLKMLYIF